jgi:hypothetical protein
MGNKRRNYISGYWSKGQKSAWFFLIETYYAYLYQVFYHKGFVVTREMIQIQYTKLLQNSGISSGASYGWFRRFLLRKKLVLRRLSGSGRELPKDASSICTEYLNSINKTINEAKYENTAIISFDETSIYLDMVRSIFH